MLALSEYEFGALGLKTLFSLKSICRMPYNGCAHFSDILSKVLSFEKNSIAGESALQLLITLTLLID
jgi:hypothetical protein